MEHVAIPLGEIHKPHNWEFISSTERTAASGFLLEDIGAISLQLDDGSYWRLSANDPATWVQFAAKTSHLHTPTDITQDSGNRFVTDAEKADWNAKQPAGNYATGGGTATGTNTGDQIIPTTLPASDVYAWAKAATKPTYTATEVGLGNVPNLAFSGSNTGDETTATIKSKLGITTLSGTNTGDQDLSGKQDVLVSGTNIRTVNGQTLLGGTDLVIASGGSTSLSGNTTIYPNQEIAYTITDFDSFSSYSVSASAGNASISGSTVTFTTPATSGSVTLTVTTNGVARDITLTVLPASVATPAITNPASAATGIADGPTITSSAFDTIGLLDTHLNTDWELWTGPNRTGTKVASLYASTSSKTSWTVSAGVLSVSTTYYPVVLHRGTSLGDSAWGTSSFTTAASFNTYIATPAATPAAFGDAFEGGFYTGMIWNELVQSSTSTIIGTGNKTFAVADMTSAPLVYAGQTLEVRSRANPANKMIGVVTGALGTTLTLNITSVGGSGTFADWSVMAQYRVIVAPKSTGENTAIAYKNANTGAPAACGTLSEGRKATLAMVAADTSTVYPAAHWCNNLSIAGKTDWYLPARDELELCWRNLKPTVDANHVTANRPTAATPNYTNLGSYGDTANTHGLDNNSSPVGAAHTSSVPAQVAAGKNFRTSESEAFAYGSSYYWSSTEYSATYAWYQGWDSSVPGGQYYGYKTSTYCVRAVRRSII